MGYLTFLKNMFVDVGLLGIPLFLCFSSVLVISLERMVYYFAVFSLGGQNEKLKEIVAKNHMHPKALREDIINIALDEVEERLKIGLGALKFIAGFATMLGLLGTVVGMIDVFESISSVKTAVSPSMISGGIKKAMYTTAYGLSTSIIAVLFCYFFDIITAKNMRAMEEYVSILNIEAEEGRLHAIANSKKLSK